jgi:XRE family transcriptional regulator, aerobic/anaerobic benzoate catabolism transcriptional regulator
MPRIPSTFGERLRQARTAAGLTQSALVRRSGIPKPTLSRYENDHVLPSLATLGRLAEALQVSPGSLLAGTPSPVDEFIVALLEAGVTIRTSAQARRIASIVADVVSTQRTRASAGRRRSGA